MFSSSFGLRPIARNCSARKPHTRRLAVEALEARVVPAGSFTQTNRVSDVPGLDQTTDANLVNPWGITLGTNSGLWVSENGAGMAESFDGAGHAVQAGVTIPTPDGMGTAAPTGAATNATSGFVISSGGRSG